MPFYFESGRDPVLQIPQVLADTYLSLATGAQIKVILCLIRFEGMPMSEESIAKHCRLTADEVRLAIDFWVQNQLLTRRGSTLCLQAPSTVQQVKLPTYSSDEILSLAEQDPQFSDILEEAQGVLGKVFNHNDASILYGIYDNLGFGGDMILQLLGFCAASGKTGFRYIERVALDWHDRGIDDFEKADAYIRHLESLRRDEYKVAAAFGIENRALSKKEKEYIARWREEWGFTMEMIQAAYDTCIDSKSKLSFAYINGILGDWQQKGWHAVDQIQKQTFGGSTEETVLTDFEKAAFAALHKDEK